MKIHKSISESVRLILHAIAECGRESAPVIATPGTYRGRPVTVLAVYTDAPDPRSVAVLPLAIVLDLEAGDGEGLTLDGMSAHGGGAPSGPSVAEDAALAVLRDVAAAGAAPARDGGQVLGVLAERAARVLAGRPVSPAAPTVSTGMYL